MLFQYNFVSFYYNNLLFKFFNSNKIKGNLEKIRNQLAEC